MWGVPKTCLTISKICPAKWQGSKNMFGFPKICSALPKICSNFSSSSLFNDKMCQLVSKLVWLLPKSVPQNDKITKICSAFPRFVRPFPRCVQLFLHQVCLMTRCVSCSQNLFNYSQNLFGKMTRLLKSVRLTQDLLSSSQDFSTFSSSTVAEDENVTFFVLKNQWNSIEIHKLRP